MSTSSDDIKELYREYLLYLKHNTFRFSSMAMEDLWLEADGGEEFGDMCYEHDYRPWAPEIIWAQRLAEKIAEGLENLFSVKA